MAPRLTRDLILDCALDITEKTASSPGKALTGASLGEALGVDRSAIWRHFEDKDDLLLAVADRMIGLVLADLDTELEPKQRLEQIFRSFIEVFGRFPFVGSELGPRNFTLMNGNRTWELILRSLRELGVPDARLVLEYRVFTDVVVALAASNALQQQASAEQIDKDRQRARTAVYALSSTEFPLIVAEIETYVSTTDEEIGLGFLRSFWAGIALYSEA